MATVTVATVGSSASTSATVGSSASTTATVLGRDLVLDQFPAFFPGRFGVEVDGAVTTVTVG